MSGKCCDNTMNLTGNQSASGTKSFIDPTHFNQVILSGEEASVLFPKKSGQNIEGGDVVIFKNPNGLLTTRSYGNLYTLHQIVAPPYGASQFNDADREATLALVRTDDQGNSEFLDLYNNGYPTGTPVSVQYGIRIQKRGNGVYRDFVFDFHDDTGVTHENIRISSDKVVLEGVEFANGLIDGVDLTQLEAEVDTLSASQVRSNFLLELSGPITASSTVEVYVNGDQVTLHLPQLSASGNGTASGPLTGSLPQSYRPLSDVNFLLTTSGDSGLKVGRLLLKSNGDVEIYRDTDGSGFSESSSETKGFLGTSVNYLRS